MFYTLEIRADTIPGAPYLAETKNANFRIF
jgi:hypothetical protein